MMIAIQTNEWMNNDVQINGMDTYVRTTHDGSLDYAIEDGSTYLRELTLAEKQEYIKVVENTCLINCHTCGETLICTGMAYRIVLCNTCRAKYHK